MAWHPLERQEYFHDWSYYYTQLALFNTSMTFDVIFHSSPYASSKMPPQEARKYQLPFKVFPSLTNMLQSPSRLNQRDNFASIHL